MNNLFIYCCGGFGREVYELAEQINISQIKWDEISFIDDCYDKTLINNVKVYKYSDILSNHNKDDYEIIIATGEPKIREEIYLKLVKNGVRIATLIHPQIHISKNSVIEEGCIVCEGTILTTNYFIKKCSIINIHCTVGHDVKIGQFCTISPSCNVSGNVEIKDRTYIGSGCNVRDEVVIGNNSIVGIGSVVTKDLPDNVVAYGSPAVVKRQNLDKIIFK